MSEAAPHPDGPTAPPTRSLWRRMRYTPMRDALRGRISGRLDLDARLDSAELPGGVAELIRTVVKRTRLWRLERLAVADELIAHFRDGIEAGQEPDGLAESFGNPKTTAKLIRRAKRRQRGWMWHTWLWSRRAVAALVIIYAGMWAWLITGKPQPTTDFIALINAKAEAIPEDQRAWPVLREAWIKAGFHENTGPTREIFVALLDLKRSQDIPTPAITNAPEWGFIRQSLNEHAPVLEVLRDLPAKAGLGYHAHFAHRTDPADTVIFEPPLPAPRKGSYEELNSESLVSVMLPHLSVLRNASRLLAADLIIAADQGKSQNVLSDLESMLTLGDYAREHEFIINELVAHRLIHSALDAMGRALSDGSGLFTDAELVSLTHRLERLDSYAMLSTRGEKMFFEDVIERVYSSSGRFTLDGLRFTQSLVTYTDTDDVFAPWPLRGAAGVVSLPLVHLIVADAEAMSAKFHELWAIGEQELHWPLWRNLQEESPMECALINLASDPAQKVRYLIPVNLLPAISAANRTVKETMAYRDALQVFLALELYRRKNGDWPATLDALVPQYLPKHPIDHSTGGSLQYRIDAEHGPVLYGLGVDGIDQGGAIPVGKNNAWKDPDLTGDWVLFPPPIPAPATADE